MKSRQLSIVSIILTVLTAIWILCMMLLLRQQGAVIRTFEDAYDFVRNPGGLFYLTYLNAFVLTACNVLLFGMLYLYFKPAYPVLSLCGILFIPVYVTFNMFVYISQISVVQEMIAVYDGLISEVAMQAWLGQFIQSWEHSAIAFVNHYAYAILGIPSVLFGIAIYRMKPVLKSSSSWVMPVLSRATGLLLVLNALACFVGMAGIITGHSLLAYGSAIGGGLFFFSLIGMSMIFWRE